MLVKGVDAAVNAKEAEYMPVETYPPVMTVGTADRTWVPSATSVRASVLGPVLSEEPEYIVTCIGLVPIDGIFRSWPRK